ncbi:hypothetical protein BFP72_09815 [Reichenbachiella sp. 5M10]|uniref:YncE family protein n=1 Tax=Reichenbachiella sp. 5M10 TaxID=1889772 RepID=UPI000C149DA4|nr:DUF5074 domain-containing protein [Reichenbachiella sp. 5M10]PIB35667.1 hypothetical protein BFP72_09815 [Reichenbachiella sp. 5M10]
MKTNSLFHNLLKASFIAFTFIFASCSEDDGSKFTPGQDGFYIVNEGGFGNGNTSLSFFDKATLSVSNNVFETVTGKPLGDQAQSMTIYDNKGYIVVQNSAKMEIISTDDNSLLATINEGLPSPRYFIGINASKGYVSDWGADGSTGTVKVIDLTTHTVTSTISAGAGTNQMVKVGQYVYAANNGGWGYDNTVIVIDTETDQIVQTLTVGDNPSTLVVDEEDDVWVTGAGKTVYNSDWSIDLENSTPAFLAQIDTDDNTLDLKIEAPSVGIGPGSLNIDSKGKTLVFRYDGGISTVSTDLNDDTASVTDFTEVIADDNISGLAVDASDDQIIVCISPNYTNPGSIKRYDFSGSFIDEYTVGIGPNGIAY